MIKNIGKILIGVLMIIIGIAVLVAFINHNNKTENESSTVDMSINEAQTKCMLMEEADLVNLSGRPFGDATTKEAQQFCMSQWDRSKNPDNTEEKFKETVKADWESRKNEVLKGYTLEEYYNETVK